MACERRYRLFSNGTQMGDWEERNCENCKKYSYDGSGCDLMIEIARAYCGDGTVDGETARRLGYLDARAGGQVPYTWPCLGLELVGAGQ